MLSSALQLIKNSCLGWILDLWHKTLENLDVLGKNGLHIRIQQEKSYQYNELFFLGFEKVLKMQASEINVRYEGYHFHVNRKKLLKFWYDNFKRYANFVWEFDIHSDCRFWDIER